jgi:hypothetical protein
MELYGINELRAFQGRPMLYRYVQLSLSFGGFITTYDIDSSEPFYKNLGNIYAALKGTEEPYYDGRFSASSQGMRIRIADGSKAELFMCAGEAICILCAVETFISADVPANFDWLIEGKKVRVEKLAF